MSCGLERREFLAGLAAALASAGAAGAPAIAGGLRRKPKAVVVFYADDLGYGDTSTYGQKRVPCPNLDRLAAEGCRFTDAHSPTSVCTPSRYSLLTGDYSFRRPGTTILDGDAKLILPLAGGAKLTLPEMMRRAGYRTAAIGKWHLGLGAGGAPTDWNGKVGPGPNEVGFDHSFIMAATADRVPCVFLRNGRVVGLDPADPIEISYENVPEKWPGEETPRTASALLKEWGRPSDSQHDKTIIDGISRIGHMRGGKSACWRDQEISDTLCREADGFLESSGGRPVFLYFCTSDVHVPRDPHMRFRGKSDLGIRGDAAVEMDDALGQLRSSLKKHGYGDTLFIFTSDNGPYIPDGYEDGAPEAWAGVNPAHPFRGGKYGPYEGGTRVPFVVSWPREIKPGTVSDALVSQTDIARTLAGIIGATVPEGSMTDSLDLGDVIVDGAKGGRAELVEEPGWGPGGFRYGKWKLVADGKGNAQLYDLADDIAETRDLAKDKPELVAKMIKRLAEIKSGK
ncbi:MAG: sulfatase-like hydrolase/transferase [Kiritimatiellae bacterium]|nr:sulfatase-like hydrolase/transferase [Kiritimatiellia bacterium]